MEKILMLNLRTPSIGMIIFVAAAVGVFNYGLHVTNRSLGDLAMTSGWFLLASFLLLGLYGLRKKLPFLPLGKTSTWLMLHLATGFLGAYFFLEHTGYRIPTGTFDILLWIGYAIIILSGFSGWILMRTIPQPLRESMHLLPARIHAEVETLIGKADAEIKELRSSTSNSAFESTYLSVLRPFLHSGPGFLPKGSKQSRYLPTDLSSRYSRSINFSKFEPTSVENRVHQLILRKSELDRQLRLHRWMRGWLLIHLPITGSMVILIGLHILVVHTFAAGSGV
jgi:hypothetical protein